MKTLKYLHRTLLALTTTILGLMIAVSVSTSLGIIIGITLPLALLSLIFLQNL